MKKSFLFASALLLTIIPCSCNNGTPANAINLQYGKYYKEDLKQVTEGDNYSYIVSKYPELTDAAKFRIVYECLLIANDMPLLHKDYIKVKKELKKYRIKIKNNKDLYTKQKLLIISSYFGQLIIKFVFKLKNKMK